MQENEKQIFKLRLKLKTGEEFEAEGSMEFVKTQKDDFLKLTKQEKNEENNSFSSYSINSIPNQHNINTSLNYPNIENEFSNNPTKDFNARPTLQETSTQQTGMNVLPLNNNINIMERTDITSSAEQKDFEANIKPFPTDKAGKTQSSANTKQMQNPTARTKPAPYLRPIKYNLPSQTSPSHYEQPQYQNDFDNAQKKYDTHDEHHPRTLRAPLYRKDKELESGQYNPAYFTKPAQTKLPSKKLPKEHIIVQPQQSVWQRIAYADDQHIILRRKDKTLSSAIAALIILGAAKILIGTPQMTALELSRSLKLSGYLKENERLDRILTPEIRLSCLVYEGSKRNRAYTLTQSGMAKAYTAAERILLNS